MRVLAVDTSHPVGAVALLGDDGRIQSIRLERAAFHLVDLTRSVGALLGSEGSRASLVDRVAIVTGPGSFTGLRIGMAFVKGLHAALGCDIVTMTSLELLARGVSEKGIPVAAMIDARKDEVYAACYEADGGERAAPRAASPAGFLASLPVRDTAFVGSGALRYRDLIAAAFGPRAAIPPERAHMPDVGLLCRVAAELAPLSREEAAVLEPFYIRPSDIKLGPLRSVRPV